MTLHEPTGATQRARTACPVDSAHGPVIGVPGARWSFYCPHQAHDGRPRTHPLGATAPTRTHFTTAEVEQGGLTDTLFPTTRREPMSDLARVHGERGAASRDEASALAGSPVVPSPQDRRD